MPSVVVAIASSIAYTSIASLFTSATLGAIVGAVAAYGVARLGSALIQGAEPAFLAEPLEQAGAFLGNEPSNTAPIPVVYGERRLGGTIVFAEVNGDNNEFLDVVYSLCEGEITAIGDMYLNNELAPEPVSTDEQVFTLSGVSGYWTEFRFKVAELGPVTGTVTGDWSTVTGWASSTYTGTLELTRDDLEAGLEAQSGPWEYSVNATPRDITGEPAPIVRLNIDLVDGQGYFDPIVLEEPSEANGYILRVQVRRRGSSPTPRDFLCRVRCTFNTPGETQYVDKVECRRHLGADDQAADPLLVSRSSRWTGDHRLRGVAYCYVRYTYDETAYPRGVPIATWNVTGRRLYDPRTSQLEDSNNPALALRDYLTNERFGKGVPAGLVDDNAIIAAANYCDELENTPGGGTEKRWTVNGALVTKRTLKANTEHLLAACRGWLTYTGGRYRLVLDKPEVPSFAWSEAEIVGAWDIALGSKQTLANRITAKFFNPDRDWQSDHQTADSEGLRARDNGLLLERTLALELVTSPHQAYRTAAITLNQARQAISVAIDAVPATLAQLVGDVGTITHRHPGWNNKEFRIASMDLKANGLVRVVLTEYAAAVYDYGEIPVYDPAPNTDLPSPSYVAPPGAPVVTEELYQTRDGAGVKAKAIVTWPASEDVYVARYQLEQRYGEDLGWTIAADTPATTAEILDVQPGDWSFRVVAINRVGARSVYSPITEVVILGLEAPPADVTGFNVSGLTGLAVCLWNPTPDLDVRIGGGFRIRHTEIDPPAWSEGQDLGELVPGAATGVTLPLLGGFYMIKAVDSVGIESVNPATQEVGPANLFGLSVLASWAGQTAWTGTFTDTVNDAGTLRLVEDAAGVKPAGDWVSTTLLTFTEQEVRLLSSLNAVAVNIYDDIDDRLSNIDDWVDIDGAPAAAATAEIWYQYLIPGGAVYSDWRRLTVADIRTASVRLQLRLASSASQYNVYVTKAEVTALA